MKDFLIFHLYGPMQSWGGVAVGEMRGTEGHPTKSGVLGLLSGALGLQRNQDAEHERLNRSLGFAVRVNQTGTVLRDYHSIQAPKAERIVFATRKDEVTRGTLKALITRRDYRQDACYTIALWNRQPYPLEDLRQALLRPHYPPYLGRKCCPPAYPLISEIISADHLKDAFQQSPLPEQLADLAPREQNVNVYWEDDVPQGLQARFTSKRRDCLLSRKRRTFQDRHEHHGVTTYKE